MIGYAFTTKFKLGDIVRLSDFYIERTDNNYNYDYSYSIWKIIGINFKINLQEGNLPESAYLINKKNSNLFYTNPIAFPETYTIERIIRRNPFNGELLHEPQQEIKIMKEVESYELDFANSPKEISVIEQYKKQISENKNNFVD